jgi:formyl-CoA transferase
MAGALDGIRVLDLTTHLAGPNCTMLLGDLGADVIKIEQPPLGDPIRAREDESGYAPSFVPQNRNKRSLMLDVQAPGGQAALKRMIVAADVLVISVRPRTRRKLGLEYAQVSALNPGIIYCSISGYGETEAARDRPVYDTSAMALSGLLSTITHDLDDPMRLQIFLADQLAGYSAAYGVMAALVARARTGRGQEVQASLLASTVAFANYSFHHMFAARARGEQRNRLVYRTAGFLFRAGDGLPFAIHVAPSPAKNWTLFLDAMQRPELAQDPRFLDKKGREQHYVALHRILSDHAKTQDRPYWLARLQATDLPAAPVNTLAEVFDEELVQNLGLLHAVADPWGVELPTVGSGIKLSDTPPRVPHRAPLPGEQSREVLAEFGFSADEIERMMADGVAMEKRAG